MGLKIETTGIEQYGAAGEGRVKALIIGGPGVGKTRWSSYFPKPIYLDCEGGLASVADRRVQFVTIKNSNDMLEALNFLKVESRQPSNTRDFNTVVVDTLDAFQRKVKDEWLQSHPNESAFRGFEAWGYLETKMQMLLTRLLNLDMNVIVAVHYTEKTISEGIGDSKSERQEYQLQLSGAIKDQVFNDFDLVGWMGTYFELDKESGTNQQKRGLTFKPTFDKPFLKDRLHVTPPWLEVKFSDDDYANLFAAVISRIDDLPESSVFGEIPDSQGDPFAPAAGVLAPLPGGALPPQDPREVPLEQFDKPTLMKMARDAGLDVKGNTLKGELVQMLREHRAKEADSAPADAAPGEPAAPTPAEAPAPEAPAPAAGEATPTEVPAETPVATAAPSASPDPAPATEAGTAEPTSQPAGVSDANPASDLVKDTLDRAKEAAGVSSAPSTSAEAAPAAVSSADEAQQQVQPSAPSTPVAESTPASSTAVDTEAGQVNPATGEILAPPPTPEQALETVTAALGAEVISETVAVEAVQEPAPAPAPAPSAAPAASGNCPNNEDGCGGVCREDDKRTPTGVGSPDNPLTFICTEPIGPNPDFIKLGYIKYRKHLCNAHYLARKAAS